MNFTFIGPRQPRCPPQSCCVAPKRKPEKAECHTIKSEKAEKADFGSKKADFSKYAERGILRQRLRKILAIILFALLGSFSKYDALLLLQR